MAKNDIEGLTYTGVLQRFSKVMGIALFFHASSQNRYFPKLASILGSKAEFEANFLGDSRYNKSEHFYLFFKPKDYVLVAQYAAAVRFESLPKREGWLSQRHFYDKSVNGNKDGFLH